MRKKFIPIIIAIVLLVTAINPISNAEELPDLASTVYLAMVPATGQIVLSANADQAFPIAEQLTVFALATIVKGADMEREITVPENLPLPNNSLQLKSGDVYTVRDLVEMTALNSSTQSLYALVTGLYDSVESFFAAVEQELTALGCKGTQLKSLSYSDPDNVTTAHDLAIFGCEYANDELLSGVSKTVYKEFCARNEGAVPYAVYCTNSLVSNYRHTSYLYRYAYGIKEAYWSADNTNHIVTLLKNGDRELILVLANAKQNENAITAYNDVQELGNFLFERFSTKVLLSADEPITERLIDNAPKGTHIILKASEQKTAFLPSDISAEEIEKKIKCSETLRAPISKGDILGEVSFYFQGNLLGTSPLYSDRSVAYRPTVSGAGVAFRILTHPVTIIVILGFIALFVILFLRQLEISRKKARKKAKKR